MTAGEGSTFEAAGHQLDAGGRPGGRMKRAGPPPRRATRGSTAHVHRPDAGARGAARRAARLLRQAPHARGRGRPRARARASARCSKDVWKQMAADGWAGVGWPKEWGGQGLHADRAVRLLRRVDARRRAGADAHDQLRRADDHAVRLARSRRSSTCRKILEGRDPLRDRLHRARRRHRPRVAARPRPCATATSTSSTARRCSRASRAAPTTSGSRCAPNPEVKKHKGISIIIVPDRHARLHVRADRQLRRHQHEHHVLRGRARARRQPRRRGEPGLGAHHQPAQPRARHAVLVGRRRAAARRRARLGAGRRSSPTAGA